MAAHTHESAAREALRALELAVRAMDDSSVDARRLALDVERVGHDLDLLCGTGHGSAEAPPPKLQVIDDAVYSQDFWMDAEDEGLGGGR